MIAKDHQALEQFQATLKKILPEDYQDCYEDVQPVSMGSAGLKYDTRGKVAWDSMWGSFCDLAMAGGPPHKGALLQPGTVAEIEASQGRYQEVVDEICRGILMVTDLPAAASAFPGWVRVECESEGMAEWLTRAIVMENVSAHCDGSIIELPAGPGYRIEKEIKNVITAFAKAGHYWIDHMWSTQQREIGALFAQLRESSSLVQPPIPGRDYRIDQHLALSQAVAAAAYEATGLPESVHRYPGWVGFECATVPTAIWLMRALVVTNVLSRREGTSLFVPVNPTSDPKGDIVIHSLIQVHAFAVARKIL